MSRRTEIKLTIVRWIMDYHGQHLFLFLHNEVKVANDEAFATSLLQNNKYLSLELKVAMVEAVSETLVQWQCDSHNILHT